MNLNSSDYLQGLLSIPVKRTPWNYFKRATNNYFKKPMKE